MGPRALALIALLPAVALAAEPLDDSLPPPVADEGAAAATPKPALPAQSGFSFGSYGRVGVGIDGAAHEGYAVNVVSRGSRLEKAPYLELYLFYTGALTDGARWRVVVTPAFAGDLFHYSGSFASRLALRNAYVETVDLGVAGLRLWAGSRMYRGDDVYLFDWWPLDSLNTVGGGAGWRGGRWDVAIHAGLNRIDDAFALQSVTVPARGLGAPGQALAVDRPRGVASFKLTCLLGPPGATAGAKASLYGEFHGVGEGDRPIVAQMRTEKLPADYGFVLGAQLGGWTGSHRFVNLFVRYAGGLAAYGEATAPAAVDNSGRATAARDFSTALSLNWESSFFGVMGGATVRNFTDAAPGQYNPANYVEGIIAARPHLYFGRYFGLAAELSYQSRKYGGFDPLLDRRLTPQVLRASLMPYVSPTGTGTYSRPQIYLLATVSRLNDDARVVRFEPGDLRYSTATVLYFGIGAEWWFESLYAL
ncbi:MAG: hypothetical protein EXR72_25415 [Myxococcales bacterium]|nr:hypothetical protein [Myxococcales bacterium]